MGDASSADSMPMVSPTEDIEHSSSDESEVEFVNPVQESLQRRNTQKANFEALLAKRADHCNEKIEHSQESQLSTARLFSTEGQLQGTLDPREYQIELFEKAKTENTIAVLATGAGKTLIAVLLLKWTIEKEHNSRADGGSHRISFFLVDSVTLSYQQAGVLRNNLDANVGHIFGALGPDNWSRETWDEYFKKYMVIVCTAEILHQCLLQAHVKMEQINLLIFDEAHHTKKDHVYARIIRDSYLLAETYKRPRIFGMTASPIDTKGDVAEGARNLELYLDSKIATASQLSQIHFVKRPTEVVWIHEKLEPPYGTSLYHQMESKFGDIESLKSVFRFAWNASSVLGRWCSDGVWRQVFSAKVLPRLEGKSPEELVRLQEASELAGNYTLRSPEEPNQLSKKVQVLRKKLTDHYQRDPDTKCIVFTTMRYTALMLLELFNALNIPNLRPGLLIGVRSDDLTGANISFRQQFLALVNFRSGEINCLFATSVAEEGLDIADCNLVVRFDLFNTMIQYIQSRGRARKAYSTYASIIERDNEDQQQRLIDVQDAEKAMQHFCDALPEDRILKGNDGPLGSYLEEAERVYTVNGSGARLTYHSALAVLSRYASSLQYEGDVSGQVTYAVMPMSNAFVCEVILPERSPIRGITGGPAANKSTAKRSAAFDTCVLLRKKKLLDDHFNSIYHKRLPAMRNAKLAISCKRTNQYDMLHKPSLWPKDRGLLLGTLYATIITFKPAVPLARKLTSMILLSRKKLPSLPNFHIYLEENDVDTGVQTASLEKVCIVSAKELSAITEFTLRVFQDVFQKTYTHEPEKMPYWLVPARADDALVTDVDPSALIDWDTVTLAADNDELTFPEGTASGAFCNRFLYDPWDGRCRYFTLSVDESLKPSDPPPTNVPHRRHMDNIMNYCISLSKNSRAKFLAKCNWDQPVFRAELARLRRNLLDRMTEQEKETETEAFICVEPLKISPIPVSVAASCLAFPAIITRLDGYLITLEACEKLDLVVRPDLALEAFTKDSDNTEEHRAQQVQFQRGMGKNYERLEFLGDCFLKMATSISLFAKNPNNDEFDFHVKRMCLICNKNLFNTAVKKELYRYIRSQSFSRHTWYPEGLSLLKGKDHSKKLVSSAKHHLAEKTIADVCEALIGASLLSGGLNNRFDMAVKSVTLFVGSDDHKATCWKDYICDYTLPKYQTEASTGSEKQLAHDVEEKLGYRFKYPKLLHSACTHPSYPQAWATVPCYQRLEFLGDSLLDMVCVEDLFARYPNRDPQWLTEHKMAMVSNKFLGALAVKIGLHKHLKFFSTPLLSRITRYAEEIEAVALENELAVDYWTGTTDPPKCLPDMVEAYLGAIFVDSNFEFEVVETFYQRHIQPFFHDMAIYDTFANKHPTTFLHNRLTNKYGCTDYCLKAGEIPGVDGEPPRVLAAVIIHDSVIAEGVASSSRYAKVKASEKALVALEDIGEVEFREKFKCNCRETENPPEADLGTAI